jgi:thiol-disulfide isomerase/thioredoxin
MSNYEYAEDIYASTDVVRPLSDGTWSRIYARRNRIHVVDFWASWCRNCDRVAAYLVDVASTRQFRFDRVDFHHVALDESVNPHLARRFGFPSIPVIFVYHLPDRGALQLESAAGGQYDPRPITRQLIAEMIQSVLRRHPAS